MKPLLAQPASEGRTVQTHVMLLEGTCSLKGEQLLFLRSIDIDKLARQPVTALDHVGVGSSMAYKHPTPLLHKIVFKTKQMACYSMLHCCHFTGRMVSFSARATPETLPLGAHYPGSRSRGSGVASQSETQAVFQDPLGMVMPISGCSDNPCFFFPQKPW